MFILHATMMGGLAVALMVGNQAMDGREGNGIARDARGAHLPLLWMTGGLLLILGQLAFVA